MMVQAPKDMGEDSVALTDSHSTPIITQPSSSKPQKKFSKRKQRKDSSPTDPILDEATNEEHVSTHSYDPSQSGEDRLPLTKLMTLCISLQEKVLDLEKANTAQAKEIAYDLQGEEVVAEKEVAKKEVSVADLITTAGEVVATTNINELTLAQTLIEIKSPKSKAITTAATTTTTTRPKARGVVVQEPNQIALDEEVARNLKAQLQAELEEERLARQKKEEATIALIES
ncbi:hypothetical protein Tco_0250442 [Tanacetum coccineum]